jgi:hypothetical protein|tara:strand:- start:133 stop:315 length:183 start_codon:yes stop_codon:yes gene_type:complete
MNTRKTLLDIIVEDKKVISSKQEKLKTLDLFKNIWSQDDDNETRKKSFKLLGETTVRLLK